jgi:hypothetical protein
VSLSLAPTEAQIAARLDALLERNTEARVLGMRSPLRRSWPEHLERRGRRFRLAWCDSELLIREQLDAVDEDGRDGIVVLTPLDTADLGADVLGRFPWARLDETDRWTALRSAVRARDIDPRLRSHGWLADLLLNVAPPAGYPPVAGGILDLDTAWRIVQERLLGLPEGRSDASALLWWSLDDANFDRLATLPDEAREQVAARLAAVGGPATAMVMAAATAGHGADALVLGLVCGVIFAEGEPPDDLREAAVRLEPFFGGRRVETEAAKALGEAAREVLLRLEPGAATARTVQGRAASLLAEIRAERHAAASPALIIGLEARMRTAAAALQAAVGSGGLDQAKRAGDLVRRVVEHDRAPDQPSRIERLEMAARLCRWLTLRSRPSSSLGEAVSAYAEEGGFVDRARHALRPGDELPDVAAAYGVIREAAEARRDAQNRSFAELMREWTAAGSPGGDPLPIERVLDAIVAPLARAVPVLLLVLDGLSFAVYREVVETLARQGWVTLARRDEPLPNAAAAVLPTVTEVSRASLLSGRLVRGDQAAERTGFAGHPALLAVSRAGKPPRLFHKAELGAGPELSVEVGDAVADPSRRVVAVVHNAVDAQLAGSDQLDLAWSSESLRQVAALLRIARDAGRVVVVTGDHGHVLDASTVQRPGSPGDRWRTAGEAPGEGEIALAGGRVFAPDGGHLVVAAWSERLRYASRRLGYHGGVSPQEVLAPVAVLAASEAPTGWVAAPPAEPAWWYDADGTPPLRLPAMPPLYAAAPIPRRGADLREPDLFAAPQPPIGVAAVQSYAAPGWIEGLLASPVYDAQYRLAGRSAPPAGQLRALLSALMVRGGRLSRTALAQALSTPLFRIGGLVNAARRVLNVDQAQILVIDGDDVVLDAALLRAQFALDHSP